MLALLASLLPIAVSAAVIDVQVGKGGLLYDPPAVAAHVGDTVVFHFVAKNHTATQSSFAAPCARAEGGFDSGFQPVAADSSDFPTFSYNVTHTNPVWVFCNQAAGTPNSHCGSGMVFAINCPADDSPNSLGHFKEAALRHGAELRAQAGGGEDPYGGGGGYGGGGYGGGGYGSPSGAAPSAPSSTNAAAPSTATGGAVHSISVGANGALTFEPNHLTAVPGDILSFKFLTKNHTVTQSSFAAPCQRFNSPASQLGIDSGFVPVAAGATPVTWNLTVNDTNPLWFYCRQGNHCGAGMVFAVNSDESTTSQRTFSAFQSAAQGAPPNATSQTPTGAAGSGAGKLSAGLGVGLVGALIAATLF